MDLTLEQLVSIMPYAKQRASTFLGPLNAAMKEWNINTPLRVAAFLATVGHESGQLRYVKELASGDAYEGRLDLGNTQLGFGVKFKGRGLIQLTGYVNYLAVMMALNINCIDHPELLELPENACRASAWWWDEKELNGVADKGDFLKISVRVNGRNKKTGFPNGWDDRLALYNKAKEVLKCLSV